MRELLPGLLHGACPGARPKAGSACPIATCMAALTYWCADTPEVTTALLKFMAEFVLNKTQVGCSIRVEHLS